MSALIRISILSIVGLFLGCTTTETINEPLPTGTLVGKVLFYQVKQPAPPPVGVKVTLEGTSLSTVTDEFGNWRIDNVPSRTYDIRFEKEGYGMMKQPGLTFIGGSVVRVAAVTMTPIPKCGSIFDAVRQIDTFYIEAHARAECSELDSIATFISEYILFVFSNSPDVSAEQDGHEFSVLGATNQARGTATVYVYKDHLKQYLDLQDSIYVAAYNVGGSGWVDPLTERTFYTSWNAKRDRTLAIKWIEE